MDTMTWYSRTYDVMTWQDAHDDDDAFAVLASFAELAHAEAFVREQSGTRYVFVRPPFDHVRTAVAFLAEMTGTHGRPR